jgi:hypothetical protein
MQICHALRQQYYEEHGPYLQLGKCNKCEILGPVGEKCFLCAIDNHKDLKYAQVYVVLYLLEKYSYWIQQVPLSDVIMFNYFMFLADQQFEEENWNRLRTVPDKEGNYEKWFCPFEGCYNTLQVLQTCMSCLFCNVENSIICCYDRKDVL